jgi:enoyl-CoA hydratase/carnithine racemase
MQKALADPAVKGIVVASAKKDFIAGGDLAELAALPTRRPSMPRSAAPTS